MDEIQRLIMEVSGQDKIRRLNEELGKEREVVSGLLKDLGAGKITLDQFGNAAGPVAEKMVAMRKEVASLQEETRRISPHNILALSYAVDDLTNTTGGFDRKIASISNNLPQLLSLLGLTGGSLGVFALIATGLASIASHWDKIADAIKGNILGIGADQLEAARKKVEDLRAEFDKLAGTRTEAETTGIGPLRKAITEGPTGKVLGAVTSGVIGDAGLMPSLQEAYDSDPHRAMKGAGELLEIQQELARRKAADLLAGAVKPGDEGRGARQTLRRLVAANHRAFPAGFLGDLERAEPEEVAAQQALDRQGELDHANLENQARLRDQERRRAEAQKALDIQGRRNAQAYDRRQEAKQKAETNAEVREAEHAAAQGVRELEAAERAQPMADARRLAARAAAAQGFTAANGNAPTPQQLDDMAGNALSLMRQGVGGEDAAMMALQSKLQQLTATAQQVMQIRMQQQRLMMGGDYGNDFSMMPAGPF